jgi:hypothetical protein
MCERKQALADNNLFPDIKKLGHCRVAAGNGNHHCGETAASQPREREREEAGRRKQRARALTLCCHSVRSLALVPPIRVRVCVRAT